MVINMKKGSIVDGATLMIVVLILAISMVMLVKVNDAIYNQAGFQAMLVAANATQPMVKARAAVASFNDLIIVVLFASAVASIISASQIRAHPKFFFFTFILQLFMVVLSTVTTTVYQDFVTPPMGGLANDTTSLAYIATNVFPNFAVILENAPIITFAITTLVAIASFIMGGKGE
jgi:hypothetical protein